MEVSQALTPNHTRLSVQDYHTLQDRVKEDDLLVCLPEKQGAVFQALAVGIQCMCLAVLPQRRASAPAGKVREGCCRG